MASVLWALIIVSGMNVTVEEGYDSQVGCRIAGTARQEGDVRPLRGGQLELVPGLTNRRGVPRFGKQIPKTIRLKSERCRALSSPQFPRVRAVYVRTRDPSEAHTQTGVFFIRLCLACAQSVRVADVELELKTITRRTTNRDC